MNEENEKKYFIVLTMNCQTARPRGVSLTTVTVESSGDNFTTMK